MFGLVSVAPAARENVCSAVFGSARHLCRSPMTTPPASAGITMRIGHWLGAYVYNAMCGDVSYLGQVWPPSG